MPRGTTLALGAAAAVGGIYLLTRRKPHRAAPAPAPSAPSTKPATAIVTVPSATLPPIPVPTPAPAPAAPTIVTIPEFSIPEFTPPSIITFPTPTSTPATFTPPPAPTSPTPSTNFTQTVVKTTTTATQAPTGPPALKTAPRKTTSTTPAPSGSYESLRALNLQIVNQYRARVGAPALTRRTSSESCVDNQIKLDAVANTFHKNFQLCSEHGQNEGNEGGSQPFESRLRDMLAGMWAEGPGGGHYNNIVSKRYKELAVGIYVDPGGKLWFANDFY